MRSVEKNALLLFSNFRPRSIYLKEGNVEEDRGWMPDIKNKVDTQRYHNFPTALFW